MRVLTAEAMQAVDRRAVEEVGIPGMVLMENAAIGLADALAERFPAARAVTILCGPGNNGGDGLALARHLAVRGYRPRTFLLRGKKAPCGDAGLQLSICRRLGIEVEALGPEDEVTSAVESAARADLWVDALFGTGLGRPLSGRCAALVEALNGLDVPCLAVDLPSGLGGGRADVFGPHVRAELTVTFAAPKIAHVLAPASRACGEVAVTDLGIPQALIEEAPGPVQHLLLAEELAGYLLPREATAHKGTYGHALLVAGSPGKAGAAVLAARAAVRSGAGLVTVAVPAPCAELVAGASLESMTLACPAGPAGGLSAEAVEVLLGAAAGKEALAVGPGLGRGEEVAAAVRRLVLETKLPLVLDADGLNAFAGRAASLTARQGATVLTPHPGELGNLLGTSAAEVEADRLAAVRAAAEATGAAVVLKGHRSLVADPGGEVWINPTGNPGMATGGMGDALTGIIAALAAAGYEAMAAAQLGVYVHGLAGDLASESRGEVALAAGDVIDSLGDAFRRLAAGELDAAGERSRR